MKKILFYITILLTINTALGQHYCFPDTNATWSVYDEKYFVSGDSIYNSTLYKKYYFSHDSVPNLTNSTFIALVREDSLAKKIYAIRKDSMHERIIYDFSLADNDTITVFPFAFFPYQTSGIRIKVQQHDTILINGNYRKRLKIIGLDQNTNIPEYWIEGIGSTFGPFNGGISGNVVFDIFYPALLCYKQDESILYDNPATQGCYAPWPTGINENSTPNDISLYPNPTNKIVNLESNSNVIRIKLITSMGQTVFDKTIFEKRCSIEMTDYPTGIYFLYIETESGIAIKKLIKNSF